jgi:hypothetical protein
MKAIASFVQKVTLARADPCSLRCFRLIVLVYDLLDGCPDACGGWGAENFLDKIVREHGFFTVTSQIIHFIAFDCEIVRCAIKGRQDLL